MGDQTHSRFSTWLWIVMTSAGYAAGFLLGFVLGHMLLGHVMIGAGMGAGVGLFQWLTLRKLVPLSPFWILANVVGLSVALGLHALVGLSTGFPIDLGWPLGVAGWSVALAVGGALTGYLQVRLMPTGIRGAHWWMVACAVGWSLSALGLAIPADMTGGYSGFMIPLLIIRNGMLAPAVAGLILGTLTAGVLVRLLRASDSSRLEQVNASSARPNGGIRESAL